MASLSPRPNEQQLIEGREAAHVYSGNCLPPICSYEKLT